MRQRKSKTDRSVKRGVVGLDQRLEKKLISYALVAGASGVTALVCSSQAEAKVVFTNTWMGLTAPIDLNNDGISDFSISITAGTCGTSYCHTEILKVLPQGSGNAVWGTQTSASALGSGVSLGSQGKFQPGHQFMARSEHGTNRYGTQGYSSRGQWVQSINRYLGVKFLIQGEVHYGWVRVDVAATQSGFLGAISGYAYETVPNKAILTGQKSGAPKKRDSGKGSASVEVLTPGKANLGTLALGVLGLQIWRRQDLGK